MQHALDAQGGRHGQPARPRGTGTFPARAFRVESRLTMTNPMQQTSTTAAGAGRALVPSRQLLEEARREGRAIAALNFYNAETLRAHVKAANECDASVILQTTESTRSEERR